MSKNAADLNAEPSKIREIQEAAECCQRIVPELWLENSKGAEVGDPRPKIDGHTALQLASWRLELATSSSSAYYWPMMLRWIPDRQKLVGERQ